MTNALTTLLLTAQAAAPAGDDLSLWSRALEFMTAEYDFVLWCTLGSVLVGLVCGLLGSYLVLRRMSLVGDVLGHAMLPGVVVAFMIVEAKLLAPLFLGALTAGLLAALALGFILRNSKTRPDAALGLVLTGFFGLGIVLLSYVQSSASGNQSGLTDFLFGNAIALTPDGVLALAVLALITIVVITLFYKHLLLLSFDAAYGESLGFRMGVAHYALMGLISLAIVASIQSVGVVLVVAMLVTPAATAYLLTDRLRTMLILSGLFGMVSGYLGALLSYLFEGWSSGPTMVLVASTFFGLAAIFGRRHGLLVNALERRAKRNALQARLALERPGGGPPEAHTSHP